MTRNQLKETLKNIMQEESAYAEFFKKALEKAGKSIPSMSDEEKKEFFNKIDSAWDGKGEKNEGNAFGAAVVAAKKAGEDEFEVGGKTFKVEESKNESLINEDLSTGLVILLSAAVVAGAIKGHIAAVGGVDDFTPIKDLKAWWQKRKSDKALNSIINKIKGDEDIVKFMKLTPAQQRGKFRSLIATKLSDTELDYLNKINRSHFQKESTIESVNEGIGTIALGVAGGLLLLKVLKFVLKKVVGAIGMNAPLPKEKLLEVVQTMVKTVIAQSSGKQIDMLQLVALQSFLKDEINAGKITTVKQIIQVIERATKIAKSKQESVNEAKFKVLASFGGYDLIEAPTEKDMIISKNGKKVGKLTKISKYLKDDIKSFINMVKSGKLGESVNEEEIKWNAVENAIINFLKMNTKILDKRVKDRDTDGVKGGLSSIIRGLTNAQRNLKLESVNEAFSDNKNLNYIMKGRKVTNVAYDSDFGFAVILDNGKYVLFNAHSARPGQSKDMNFESVNELKKLPNGNFSIKKGYNTFADYEKNAKPGDTILKYDKRGSMVKTFVSGNELNQNAKKYLSKVHSIVGDKVNLSLFGKQGIATVPDYEKKEVGVLVLESVNEDFKSVVGKTVFSDGKGKLHFGYYKEDDSAYFVDYKTWAKLGMKDVSKGDTNKDKVINSILRNQKQFNKKVDYNMWAKKTNPSFEEKMDWFIKNGWISNITKAGIKEGVESVNEYNVNKKFGSKYDIGAGSMGNGTTFWNRAEEEFGDYKKIAHVSNNGEVKFYDKTLPSNVKKHIEDYAKTQKESVNEGVKLSLVDPNTNKFIKTLSLDRTYREAEKEVETLNRRLSSSQKAKGFYWKVSSINESVNEGRAFINAARKAKAEGKTEFEFNGKKYPVTLKEGTLNEMNPQLNKAVKTLLDKELKGMRQGGGNHLFAVMNVLMGALTDANFHSESKKVPALFGSKAKYEGDPMGKRDMESLYQSIGEKIATMAKWDGEDIAKAIGFYVSMTVGRPMGEKIEKLV